MSLTPVIYASYKINCHGSIDFSLPKT